MEETENQPITVETGPKQYYIEDGVHRAVALRENGVTALLPAILFAIGQTPKTIAVSLDQLHSPRATVSRIPTRRHDLPAMIAWLSTPAGRAKMPPLHLQPLGEPGQTGSVPLAQVQITN